MIDPLKKVFKYIRNFVLIIIVFTTIFALFINIISQNKKNLAKNSVDAIQINRQGIYKTILDKKLNSTPEGRLSVNAYRILSCSLVGEACTNNPQDGDKNYHKSTLGALDGLITMPFMNPPASGVYWVYNGLQNTGFITKTYAAEGIGFSGIKPFSNLWKIFRDLSYMLLVIVLIVIGFMIMFRAKINPQTIISVENSLPKIVITLILITFSFAIVGFLIDLMYLTMALSISLISNNNTYYDSSKLIGEFLTGNIGVVYSSMFPPNPNGNSTFFISGFSFLMTFGSALLNLLGPGIVGAIRFLLGLIVGVLGWRFFEPVNAWVGRVLSGLGLQAATFGAQLGNLPEAVIYPGITIILVITAVLLGAFFVPQFLIGIFLFLTIIYTTFRILAIVFRAYIQIVLMTILAPFIILFEAIPGRNAFAFWFKSVLGEIITFPIITSILVLSRVVVNTTLSAKTFWTPPFINGIDGQVFSYLIGMGLVYMIPDLVKFVKEALGIKPMPFSLGIGTFFAGAGAALTGGQAAIGLSTSLIQTPFLGRAIFNAIPEKFRKSFLPPSEATQITEGILKHTEALAEKAGIKQKT